MVAMVGTNIHQKKKTRRLAFARTQHSVWRGHFGCNTTWVPEVISHCPKAEVNCACLGISCEFHTWVPYVDIEADAVP